MASPKVQVAKQDVDGEIEQLRVGIADFTIVGCLDICVGRDVGYEIVANLADVLGGMVAVGLLLGEYRLGYERYTAIVDD